MFEPLPIDGEIDHDCHDVYARAVAHEEALASQLKAVRAWIREADETLMAALRAGTPVAPGIICRIDEREEPAKIDWKAVAAFALGEEKAQAWWTRAKIELDLPPRRREEIVFQVAPHRA